MVSQYANDDYLNPAPTNAPIQGQGQQAPPQQSTLGRAANNLSDQWDQFISHPEHRAGMMQFAVNMLSGRGLGESIGSAAEATGRNVEKQQEESRYEEAQALKEQEAARKERETEYYGMGQRKKSGADVYYEHLGAKEDAQQRAAIATAHKAWLGDVVPDAYFKEVQRKYPQVKNKADLLNPANREALDYSRSVFAGELERRRPGGGEAPSGPVAIPPKPSNVPGAVLMNLNGKPTWYDPKTKLPAQ